MKIIYIAGPFRAPTPRGVHLNVMAAEEMAADVAILGAMPCTPHSIGAHMEGIGADDFWLKGTLELMRRCDAVIVVPGWKCSVGAMSEIEEAKRLELPVFSDINELADWLSLAQGGRS